MRATERTAIESGAVSGLTLMERAGEAVVEALLAEWPAWEASPGRAVVLCGPGNNGGDGYVIARLLQRRGWQVRVFALGDPARLPPDARVNHDRWGALGEVIVPAGEGFSLPEADLVVDALFGIGLTRPFDGPFARLPVADLRAGGVRVVAVDVPSGLDADTGQVLGQVVPADLTITFHRAKPGHVQGAGPAACGKLVVADIGLPA